MTHSYDDNPLSPARDRWTGNSETDRALLVGRALEAMMLNTLPQMPPYGEPLVVDAEAATPVYTAQTLRDTANAAWQTHASAITPNKYIPSRRSLVLYPTDDRHDVIEIHPIHDFQRPEDGNAPLGIERTTGKWITGKLGVWTDFSGQALAYKVVGVPGNRYDSKTVDPTEADIAQMQEAIAGASTVRPQSKIVKALGRYVNAT